MKTYDMKETKTDGKQTNDGNGTMQNRKKAD